ncbi:hypothetical protein RRG08_057198 [Elysia crispata]|uniref:Uncharacterized protein n=1 Tax=Elysia crispata TaxID=231223 RepID=A0AAE0XWQ0_9GAST|nr:hypothetical protein RRG08_057198 [Elysia crispata]
MTRHQSELHDKRHAMMACGMRLSAEPFDVPGYIRVLTLVQPGQISGLNTSEMRRWCEMLIWIIGFRGGDSHGEMVSVISVNSLTPRLSGLLVNRRLAKTRVKNLEVRLGKGVTRM